MPKLSATAEKPTEEFKVDPADIATAKGEDVVDAEIVPDETPAPSKAVTKTPIKKVKVTTDGGGLFATLSETKEYLRILEWGREGSAKTTNILSAANLGKVLIINAEGGLKKVALKHRGINTDNILVYPRQEPGKPATPITHAGLDEVYREVQAMLANDPDSLFLVAFDSATDIVEAMVTHVSKDRVSKVRRRGIELDEIDEWFTDRGDYGTMSKMFRDILRKFRDLPVHVAVTALERRDVDEDTGKTLYGPAVSPGLQTDLLGYMDIVIYTRAPDEDKDYFRGATKKAGKFRSKDRLDMLPAVMVEPTVERILAYINEDVSEASDPMQKLIAVKPKPEEATAPKTSPSGRKSPAAATGKASPTE